MRLVQILYARGHAPCYTNFYRYLALIVANEFQRPCLSSSTGHVEQEGLVFRLGETYSDKYKVEDARYHGNDLQPAFSEWTWSAVANIAH
jgi:hypothetical protein